MRCKTVRKLLDDHVDGLLPAAKSETVRSHLDDCIACDTEAEELRAATTPLATWGDLEPPAGCFDQILARIDALPPDAREPAHAPLQLVMGGARWLATSGLAAAAVLALAIVVPRGEEGPPALNIVSRRAATAGSASPAPRFSLLRMAPASLLKAGEERLEIAPPGVDENDGLRRRRRNPDPLDDLAVPVGFPAEPSPR